MGLTHYQSLNLGHSRLIQDNIYVLFVHAGALVGVEE